MLRSPLNYTGNKYRILPQILPYFPEQIDTMVDLFCGGATVGSNVNCRNIVFIDKCEQLISLLQYLSTCEFERLLKSIEQIIGKYGLSYSAKFSYSYYKSQINDSNINNGLKEFNRIAFYNLRADYNALLDKTSEYANQLLYLLIVYGFNNDLRFSKNGDFNLPVGKTDLNQSNLKKIKEYIDRMHDINSTFICCDFDSERAWNYIDMSDFIYLDPPYLITTATYNENNWNVKEEERLLNQISIFLEENKFFALSNVLSKEDAINKPLSDWIEANAGRVRIIDIDYHYRSSSYNKKNRNALEREVLIIPIQND